DAVLSGFVHLAAPESEEGGGRVAAAELSDNLCAVVIDGGLTGGDEEGRVGHRGDDTSVESSWGDEEWRERGRDFARRWSRWRLGHRRSWRRSSKERRRWRSGTRS